MRGFTLVELLVTLAIITIVLAIILVSQTSFNRSILLIDTAYTVALSVRQSQSLGISGRIFSSTNNTGYGIHFDTNSTPINSYKQFADVSPSAGSAVNAICPGHTVLVGSNPEARPGNCLYDGASELVTQYNFSQRYTIGKFCGTSNAVTNCSNDASLPLTSLDITFERPNIQTVMIGSNQNGEITAYSYDTACIEIDAPAAAGGTTRYVKITRFGQILVTSVCP